MKSADWKHVLKTTLDRRLLPEGYRRLRGWTWYCDTPESVGVIHIDKSPHGNLCIPYIGLVFKAVCDLPTPPFNKCSWYGKLVCRVPQTERDFVPILDWDRVAAGLGASGVEISDHSLATAASGTIEEFVEYIIQFAIPFLKKTKTLIGFSMAYSEGAFRHFPIGTARILGLVH